MDITIDVEDYKLNVRSAWIIIHNGEILVHRNINSDQYALVGGRVKIREKLANTVKKDARRIWKRGWNNRLCSYNRKIFWNEGFKVSWDNVCT